MPLTNPAKAQALRVSLVKSSVLEAEVYGEVVQLCNAAYGEDLSGLMATFGAGTHVLAAVGQEVVSHAMWVTRWLQPAGSRPLETAYVEVVATHPAYQRRGYATQVMQRLAACIPARYELAALCPATNGLYQRLGWRFWRGPLSIRLPSGELQPTPDEAVMVLALPGRPLPDLDRPLSAEWREGELW